MAALKFNKRNVIKWLFAVTAIILVSVVVLILAVRSLEPDPPFQFLHDRKPVLRERFNSFTISIYSFPAAMEVVCAEASAELASLAFLDTSIAENHIHDFKFENQNPNNPATITILSGKLSNETTNANYIYKDEPCWVSVDITQYGRTNWLRILNRVSGGLFPLPADPPIKRTRFEIPSKATRRSLRVKQ